MRGVVVRRELAAGAEVEAARFFAEAVLGVTVAEAVLGIIVAEAVLGVTATAAVRGLATTDVVGVVAVVGVAAAEYIEYWRGVRKRRLPWRELKEVVCAPAADGVVVAGEG